MRQWDITANKQMVLRDDMGNGYVDYYFTKR